MESVSGSEVYMLYVIMFVSGGKTCEADGNLIEYISELKSM